MAPESEPEVIRQQMDETRNALTDKIATLEQQVVETVQGASAGVNETVQAVKDAVQDTVQTMRDTVGDTVESVRDTFSIEKQMERRPWMILAMSAGVGFAAGYLVTPPSRRSRSGYMPPLSSHLSEGYHPSHVSPMAAVSSFDAPSPAQTSSNGADRERSESRTPEPVASKPSAPGIFDTVAHTFEGEIAALKGLALGALGGLVRDLVVPQIPAAIKDKVEGIINDFTKKLGGEPVRGPLFGQDEHHDEQQEGSSRPEPFGSRMGSRS